MAPSASCSPSLAPADIEFGNLEEIDDTIFYLQDIPVVGCKEEARVFWDDGSNRVFIREQYAEKMNLRKKAVKYSLETVGQEAETRSGFVYLVELIDVYGNLHKIWGYSIDKIMN